MWVGVQKINLGLFCSFVLICSSFSSHPWGLLTSVTSVPVIQKPEKETFFLSFPFQSSPRQGETLAATEDIQSQDEDGGGQYPLSVKLFPIFI